MLWNYYYSLRVRLCWGAAAWKTSRMEGVQRHVGSERSPLTVAFVIIRWLLARFASPLSKFQFVNRQSRKGKLAYCVFKVYSKFECSGIYTNYDRFGVVMWSDRAKRHFFTSFFTFKSLFVQQSDIWQLEWVKKETSNT